jgi:hypothetical protein
MVKEEILLASHQLSALLLNLSTDPDSFVDQHEPRRTALFVLLSDLSIKIDEALTEMSHV